MPTNPADRLAAIEELINTHFEDVDIGDLARHTEWLLAELRTLQQQRDSFEGLIRWAIALNPELHEFRMRFAALTAEREPEQAYTKPPSEI